MEIGRAQRMIAVVTITILVGAVAAPRQTYAQSGWLIIPGKSWGPVSIGDTEEGVRSALGVPESTDNSTYDHVLKYRMARLYFARELSAPASSPMKVWMIVVWDPGAATREGVRIGARLQDVLRVYGDTNDNAKAGPPAAPGRAGPRSNCLDISTYAGTMMGRGTQASYEYPDIALNYLDRGVTFELQPGPGAGAGFGVTFIDVEAPAACRPR